MLHQIINPPLRRPPSLPLNPLQQAHNCRVLVRMAHQPPRDPHRLHCIGPRAVMIVGKRNTANLARVPENAADLAKRDIARFALKHENRGRVRELVP